MNTQLLVVFSADHLNLLDCNDLGSDLALLTLNNMD